MATDYFFKLATIEGEATDKGYEKQIKVESFSWGGAQHSTISGSGGSGAGKVSMSDLSMTIVFDKAVPKLQQALTKGTHLATGTLSAVKAGGAGKPYLTVDLTEVFVSSLQYSGAGEVPAVSVSLTYKSNKITYFTQDAKGVLTAAGTTSYDVTTNVTT